MTTTTRSLPLRLPPGWRRCPTDEPGVIVVARPPRPGRASSWVALRVDEPPDRDADPGPAAADLEDEDEFDDDLGRTVAYRRWSPADDPSSLRESWSWDLDGARLTLRAACARDDYLDLCDLFEDVARSVEVDLCAPLAHPA